LDQLVVDAEISESLLSGNGECLSGIYCTALRAMIGTSEHKSGEIAGGQYRSP
jgi:hypothetical protein